MRNNDKKEWAFDEHEKYAIAWLESHGFDVVVEKRYISKDIFTVSRDGVTDKFQLPLSDKSINYEKYLAQYEKSFDMLCELQRLKAEVKE